MCILILDSHFGELCRFLCRFLSYTYCEFLTAYVHIFFDNIEMFRNLIYYNFSDFFTSCFRVYPSSDLRLSVSSGNGALVFPWEYTKPHFGI